MITSGRKWEKMYFGYYEHVLDDKGRLSLPRKLREGLQEGSLLYILKGFDGCLSVYNESEFQALCKEVSNISYNKKDSRSYLRVVLGSVVELTLDKVNRVQLPTQILNKYQIGRNVALLGVGDHFEIWDLQAYKVYEKDALERFEEVAEGLEDGE